MSNDLPPDWPEQLLEDFRVAEARAIDRRVEAARRGLVTPLSEREFYAIEGAATNALSRDEIGPDEYDALTNDAALARCWMRERRRARVRRLLHQLCLRGRGRAD